MSTKPNYSRALTAVTDGAEVTITAQTFCGAVYIAESPAATGWPRSLLIRLTVPGSAQHTVAPGSSYKIPGPFQPGDVVCTVELASAGGDSSSLNIAELTQ